jgi:hypothetical protein
MPARARAIAALALTLAAILLLTAASASAAPILVGHFGGSGEKAGQHAEEAGQLQYATALVTDSVGDVYVGDAENDRVSKFSSTGRFQLAFGYGVRTGAIRGTATFTSGSTHVTSVFSESALSAGEVVEVQEYLPAGTTITALAPGELTLSNPAINSGTSVTFFAHSEEPQTCTTATECSHGYLGSSPGQFGFQSPKGLAVDASGDVYAADSANHRVEKFGPEGEFLLMFGGQVNKTKVEEGKPAAEQDLCTKADLETGDVCGAGVEGNAPGQIGNWEGGAASPLAFGGPEGDIYVGDEGRVDVFAPSGAFVEQISLATLSPAGKVHALAVDASGDLFVQIGERLCDSHVGRECKSLGFSGGAVLGVHELEPNGTEKAVFDPTGFATGLALTPSGDLYIADPEAEGGLQILAYHTSSGAHFQSFDPELGELASQEGVHCMTYSLATHQLYVTYSKRAANDFNFSEDLVGILAPPPPGPLIASQSAEPKRRGAATLEAKVNPEGNPTQVRFQYVDDATYQKDVKELGQGHGFDHATATAPVSIGETFSPETVETELPPGSLEPGVTYRFRALATNSEGEPSGEDQSFEETPAALLEGPWSSEVASTSADLQASVNPLGSPTTYKLQYGTSESYGQTLSGDLGGGEGPVSISRHLTGLEPNTTYHFRLTTENECEPATDPGRVCTVTSPDHSLTTQLPAASFALPDERVWEQVSPPNKHGVELRINNDGYSMPQAAAAGSRVAYEGNGAMTEEASASASASEALSTRAEHGWGTQEILPSPTLDPAENGFSESTPGFLINTEGGLPRLFSSDLSLAIVKPSLLVPPLSPAATQNTFYLRDTATGSYLPLITACPAEPEPCPPAVAELADAPPGSRINGRGNEQMLLLAATPDLTHVVFASPLPLTPAASISPNLELCDVCDVEQNLYEWSASRPPSERLQLLNRLPGGLAAYPTEEGARANTSVSANGRSIVWAPGALGVHTFYVRDTATEQTLQIGHKRHVAFQAISADGSEVFYTEEGDLWRLATATATATDLTAAHGPGEASAGGVEVLGTSEGASHVYFLADGVLTGTEENANHESAQAAKPNLYLYHEGAIAYVATLSSQDSPTWKPYGSARVSPDGRYAAFMSERSLTAYDNRDAASGEPDEELFLFDAATKKLICASCNPTGARPHGFRSFGLTLTDPQAAWSTRWLAGSISGWRQNVLGSARYRPRNLAESGRLFFDSRDSLVPQDTNGKEDVYEYEPTGVGDCTQQSPTFHQTLAGCLSLISSGTSKEESAFLDASESGNDVFFLTTAQLARTDIDSARDLYDARVAGGFPEPLLPPKCEGDACQPPVPAPEDETPGSLTYHGPGNEHPTLPARKHHRHKKHHHRPKRHRRAGTNRGSSK